MDANQLAETHRPFSNAVFTALAAAITEASGSPWLVAAVPDAQSTADESQPVRLNLTLDGALRGEFQLELRRGDATTLASRCLRQLAEEFGTEQSQGLLEVIDAGMSKLRLALAEEYGAFTIRASLASEPASERANSAEVTVADDSGNRVSIGMYLNPVLEEALSLHANALAGRPRPAEQVNLQLVMDVELNVTLRFGQRQLALREVLELTSGSVIELDRQVEEPVELLLEGKVIARGEAVVIDGNYGLRVTEVPQPIPSPVRR
jgi:flagellar motor switch protein FliN/FliY